ncbi:hypothetical protein Lnau_0163 [Legionella nautarum]|uniref:Uncharacterized protein n=1 Tax=Legionella nautarum TaxID=45070 RepID=A0A0W0X4H7_9GAMM|nr:hypothetical protein Lnau_0163 [Legionella nautarum]
MRLEACPEAVEGACPEASEVLEVSLKLASSASVRDDASFSNCVYNKIIMFYIKIHFDVGCDKNPPS